MKQTSDRRPRATITAAAPHRAAFVSNGQIYRKNNPGGEGVAFESVTRLLQSLSFFSLCSCFVFCTLSHTHTSAHTNSCMLGNVVLFLVARSPALMLYIQLSVSAVMTPVHIFHESKELLSYIAGKELFKSLINIFIGLNIIINIVPP